jgi:ABC-type nitrate/sulfonate/bicarbonate transport system ATPase subunit
VVLANVSKSFPTHQGALPVLQAVDLRIEQGSFVALLGPSGCGKSTLLRLVGGLEQPSDGAVTLGKRPVETVDPRCAMVFQEPRLFPWKTVAENVAIGARRRADTPAPAALLQLVGLSGFEESYPHQLSGGMAQRAALARALIGRPEVLLLDEPFAALDALTRMQMQDLLVAACRSAGATVVMVTHDIDEALYLADRVVLMAPRPTFVQRVIDVPLARPRDRGSPVHAQLRTSILSHFGLAHTVAAYADDIYAI